LHCKSIWTEGVRSLLPAEEKAQADAHHSIPVLKGWIQRGQRLALHKEPHGEDKGQWVKVAVNKRKSFFSVRTISHWKNLLKDVLESLSL